MKPFLRFGFLFLALLTSSVTAQTIRYVSTTGTNNNPATATSWATSTTNLQGAINASAAGDQVWVRAGVYKPTGTPAATGTDRTISFAMKNGVAIYGGFAGTENALGQRILTNPLATTLSGEIGNPASTTDNSYHVIRNTAGLTSTAILDGFVITGGNANSSEPNDRGGAMHNFSPGNGTICTPLFRNCLFINNRASFGAVSHNDGSSGGNSSPTFINCAFLSNTATVYGGVFYNYGAIGTSSPVLTNCTFQNNVSSFGNLFFSDGNSGGTVSPALINCVVWGNGTGIMFANNSSSVLARYSLFEPSVTGYTSVTGNLTTSTSPFASTTSTQLATNSPAINAGDPATTSALVGTTDLAGNPRFLNGRVDMGAYELPCPVVTRLYVRANATGANTGQSWTDAFTDLQSALNYGCLQTPNAEIWVAAGTYKPTSTTARTVSFAMRNGVAIYGGFAGTENNLSQRVLTTPLSTTLSGDIGTVGNITDNSYHVISNPPGLTNSAILDGFIIVGGNANSTGFPNSAGGGMYNNGRGSGNVCNPTIRNCSFQNNTATVGGAMFNDGFLNMGTSSPVLTNCSFLNNSASNEGGAMYNSGSDGNSSPVLTNCSFQSNTAATGGAMYNDGTIGNSNPALTNCSFLNNIASFNGGAMYNNGDSGNSNPVLTNCVLFGNGGTNTFFNSSASITTRYSFFESSITDYTTGPGNLTATISPFASPASTLLAANSPAINAGDPATTTAVVGITDLGGNPRFVNGRVDMGAYEFCTPATRLYVRAGATGANTGQSWTDAFTDLQSALTYPCSQSLTEVWVANGTYKPTPTTDRTVSFAMRNGVAIYGGFVGTETALNERPAINLTAPSGTTLSGDIGTVGNSTDNSYHVIANGSGLTTTAILDGFVITGGNANGSFPNSVGGGIYNDGSNSGGFCNPLIRNCLFQGNGASSGGAIYNNGFSSGNSSPVLTNCAFQSNTASAGGAIYNNGSTAGNSSPILTNCAFQSNTAGAGGALFNYGQAGSSRPLLINCSFQSNRAVLYGGAILGNGLLSGNASLTLVNCSFQDNTAQQGGALFNDGNVSPLLTNCVLWNNGGTNTFFYVNLPASATATYSLFEPSVTGYTSVTGNLTTSTSPFISTTSLQLAACSPAINAGDPATTTAVVGTIDLAGNPRFFAGGRIDLGTYEFQGIPTAAPTRLYVWANATGANTGLSWADAFTDLQSALAYPCSQSLTEIWVANGLYKPTATTISSTTNAARSISFSMLPNVAIYGGFSGTETALGQRPAINLTTPSGTTLSGEIGNPSSSTDNSYHVISNPAGLTTTAILDGFIITGGNANGSFPNNVGGGMYNDGRNSGGFCNPLIRNSLFQGNEAIFGGAVCNNGSSSGNSSPILTSCSFQSNTATNYGGAIYNVGNSIVNIGPALNRCSFQNNRANFGGAMYHGSGNALLTNASFIQNSATTGGGAIYYDGSATTRSALTNVSFTNNTAGFGGDIRSFGGGSSLTLTNGVVFTDGAANGFAITGGSSLLVNYSLLDSSIPGGAYTSGPGNLTTTTSPFASTTSTQLATNSPAINAGDPATTSATVGLTDLAGNPRFVNGRIDMGAYEFCAPASRLYVRANATGANTGLSWVDAFTDLQSALTYPCSQSLTEVWVAAGTYKPTATTTARTASFSLLSGVAIYGGFPNIGNPTMNERNPATNPTILSGDIDGVPDVVSGSGSSLTITGNGGNSLHVVSSRNNTNARLDGFIVSGGNATDGFGGGITITAVGAAAVSSLTLSNCTFTQNRASAQGGGLYTLESNGGISKVWATSCTFTTNIAQIVGGGGLYLGNLGGNQLTDCIISNNRANNAGGGLFASGSVDLSRCTVSGNVAGSGSGGGLLLTITQSTSIQIVDQIVDCIIVNNTAATFGGGIFSRAVLTLNRAIITGNTSSTAGGLYHIIAALTMTNTVVRSNTALAQAGGVQILDCPDATLTNCEISTNNSLNGQAGLFHSSATTNTLLTLVNSTIANNLSRGTYRAVWTEAQSTSFTATTRLKNSIVSGNFNGNFGQSGAGASLQSQGYNLESDNTSGFTNGINGDLVGANPLFISAIDLRLQATSPAINAGDPASTSATVGLTDLAGAPRFVNTLIDMGAYEFQGILEVFTLKDGLWNDPSVWSVGRLPLGNERVRLKHVVTIPTGHLALSGTLIYDPVSKLIYATGGRLQLGQ